MLEALRKVTLNRKQELLERATSLGYHAFFNWQEFADSQQFAELAQALENGTPLGIDFACSHHVTLSNWGTNWSSNKFCARLASEISTPNILVALDPHIIKGVRNKENKRGSGNPNWASDYPRTTPIMISEKSYDQNVMQFFRNRVDIGVLVCPSPNQESDIIGDAFQMLKPKTGSLVFIPDPEDPPKQNQVIKKCFQKGFEPIVSTSSGSIEYIVQDYPAYNLMDYQASRFPDSYYIRESDIPYGIRVFIVRKLST